MSCSSSRELTNDSRVKVEENGAGAVFLNLSRSDFYRVKVDGGVVSNVLSADYVVYEPGVGAVVVELKGSDISRAVDQIDATLDLMKGCGQGFYSKNLKVKFAGLIVCSKYPRSDSVFQNKLKRFVAKHKIPLHCVARKDEFNISKVVGFDGPK